MCIYWHQQLAEMNRKILACQLSTSSELVLYTVSQTCIDMFTSMVKEFVHMKFIYILRVFAILKFHLLSRFGGEKKNLIEKILSLTSSLCDLSLLG